VLLKLKRSSDRFQLFGAHELITIHSYRNFERAGIGGWFTGILKAAEHFAQAANADRRITSGQGNQVLDSATHFDRRR